MHGASPSHNSSQSTARDTFVEQETGLRDISLEQLGGTFELTDVLAIDAYQQRTSIERLSAKPLPEAIKQKYGLRSDMLQDNTSTYDEEGEDLLFDDELICRIVSARQGRSNNLELTALFRVRRSVVAFILFHWNSIDKGEQPQRAS